MKGFKAMIRELRYEIGMRGFIKRMIEKNHDDFMIESVYQEIHHSLENKFHEEIEKCQDITFRIKDYDLNAEVYLNTHLINVEFILFIDKTWEVIDGKKYYHDFQYSNYYKVKIENEIFTAKFIERT